MPPPPKAELPERLLFCTVSRRLVVNAAAIATRGSPLTMLRALKVTTPLSAILNTARCVIAADFDGLPSCCRQSSGSWR